MGPTQDTLYLQAAAEFGGPLERLAGAYEADADRRRDLLQEIHFQLWRSFARFENRSSLRTWVYRVAHHVAISHVVGQRRIYEGLTTLDRLEREPAAKPMTECALIEQETLARLYQLIRQLKPLDRQIILLYLEELDAAAIGEITGLSPPNVAMKIHRIKKVLAAKFPKGVCHAE